MKKKCGFKKYCIEAGIVLLALCAANTTVVAATLTASTSLTVVNVTEFRQSIDVTQYEGAWPNTHDDHPTNPDDPNETYLKSVDFDSHAMYWSTTPSNTPYASFPNTVNSMICAVWSQDGGKTFTLQSWDYLATNTHGKGLHNGMPDCWMGTMIHTLCDRTAGECNGRYRTNLRFSEYPNNGCWGSAVME